MTMMTTPVIVMAGIGFLLSLALAIASRYFHVEEDPALKAIKDILPGLNCGGCGFAGCEGAAKALMAGKATVNLCVGAGPDVAEKLADLLGLSPAFKERLTAVPGCTGGGRGETRYYYPGLADCRAETLLYGGSLVCDRGCLGHGTCTRACRFHALDRPQGMAPPKVDPSRCRGCRQCSNVCPRGAMGVAGELSRLIHLYRIDECLAPCRQKCPAQINIPLFITQVLTKDYHGALLTIRERNPLVMCASRVCPHTCENICRRNIADQGIAVGWLERFVGEWEMASGVHLPTPCAPDSGHRIAVIGGGPAGLSCAYFLKRLGHQPTIFEAKPLLGGMMRYGLPEYRLPRKIVDWEIQGILNLGIDVETGKRLGKDFFLEDLSEKGFASIFIGTGAWVVPPLCIRGEVNGTVVGSLDFLSKAGSEITSLKGRKVAVIGESNTAMDCARTCIRLQADSVTVICPCERSDMSARKRDVDRALEEGVFIHFSRVPVRLSPGIGTPMARLECRPAESPGREATEPGNAPFKALPKNLDVDLIIAAYERKPDLDYLLYRTRAPMGFKASRKGNLAADADTLLAAQPNVFAAGDLYTGRATVINAVADGRRAARSIHHLLTLGRVEVPENLHRRLNTKSIIKDVRVETHGPRVTVPELPIDVRIRSLSLDIVGSITEQQALEEANRCLRCGTTCYDPG